MNVDLLLLEHWLRGWSLARGLPLPVRQGGGLMVNVGWPEQLRRHLFVDAGIALQQCARDTTEPRVFLKAAVDPDTLQRAVGPLWSMEAPRYFMAGPATMGPPPAVPEGYMVMMRQEHGASVITLLTHAGEPAACGRIVIDGRYAIFDRIGTEEAHRGRGLAQWLMGALDALAQHAQVSERLLVATGAGRRLYLGLGWQVLAPYSTVVRR